MVSAKDVKCPTCSANVALRVSRSGFLQKVLLAPIGVYPWKCGACGTVFLFRHRGYRGLPPGQTRAEARSRRAA